MSSKRSMLGVVGLVLAVATLALAPATQGSSEKVLAGPNGQAVSVKMIGPVTQTTELQIICVLQHDPAGDKYIEAMDDLNTKLGRLLSNLREEGAFAGELGETLLLTPPAGTIAPKRLLLIGVGPESALSLDTLRLVGRIAARESTRLGAATVSFAPTLRDQGSTRLDVGEGDGAFMDGWIAAYAVERRLQAQGLAGDAEVKSLTVEAGPRFFEAAGEQVGKAIERGSAALKAQTPGPLFVR